CLYEQSSIILVFKFLFVFPTFIGFTPYNPGRTFIFISLFSIIIFNNFLGLFPYVFTSTKFLIKVIVHLSDWNIYKKNFRINNN
ncbi:hypothetical protein L9F63_028303, partial [Diploptera punctata]